MAKQVFDSSKFAGVRLPTSIKPTHYDLSIKPNLDDFTFDGCVKIDYTCANELPKYCTVHANELKISSGHLENNSSSEHAQLSTVYYNQTTETATLEFDGDITPNGSIVLNFSGILNDRMKGFYRTAFKIDDTTVHAATTQFEATDARRCFPCWDEPAIKATFSVTLTAKKTTNVGGKELENVVLSNMPEISRSDRDSEVEVKFDKTPIMSTYLLAFIIGPFEMIESNDSRRPIRVYTTPGKKEHGRFALEVACKSLPFYEDYFCVKYPLPKMDLIAIPDFSNGAMENWGLVTYRETALLVDPENTATQRRHYIAIVVAHELAHQWFGNLVTMEWWTHLWLNEGFASFMEYLCVHHIFPEYEIWNQFVTDAYGQALQLDSLHNSHPIEVPVNHPSEIDEIFDTISYSKGASVIRMLFEYIGDDSFRRGMKDYLTKFAYKNTSTEDLWDCLESASNKPVRKLMSGWTGQTGYPFISLTSEKVGDKTKLKLCQCKFTSDGKISKDEADTIWTVPVNVTRGSNPTLTQELCLLEEKSKEIEIDDDGSWLKLNPGSIGLYRCVYPDALIQKLYPVIMDKSLSPMDRLSIQSDTFALCQAGKINTVDLLKLVASYKNEDVYTVWRSIDLCIGQLGLLFKGSSFKDKFESYGRNLYGGIFGSLGWAPTIGESDSASMTRGVVLNRLISLGDTNVIDEAKKKYHAHLAKTTLIPADLRAPVYRAIATYGDDQEFESLFQLYKTEELSEEKNRVLRALGFANNTARLEKAAKFVMSEEVRIQDKFWTFASMGGSDPSFAFKTFQENKDFFREKYGTTTMMSRLIEFSISSFISEEKAQEVEKYFEANKFPGAERVIAQSLESIRINAAWSKRDEEAVKAYLEQF